MANRLEAKKNHLVRKSEAAAGDMIPDPVERALVERFIALFYEHVPPADIAERSPADLCAAALALRRFAGRRRPGQTKIRVYNPDIAEEGWSSPYTIVEIVNDDMAFLVDSITGAINRSERIVHLLIHPILSVTRDTEGRLDTIGAPGRRRSSRRGARESWMQIEITRERDPEGLVRLTQTLSRVVEDVRLAVADWQPMRQTLRALIAELSADPVPPVPAGERTEVVDFLRWLGDDNFTFLGYREYEFAGVAATGRPPLGILRDPDHPVFGGLRDLSSLPADVQDFVRRRELLIVTKSNQRATVHRTAHMDAVGLRRFGPDGAVVGVRLILGLFASLAYSRGARTIPLLRLKTRRILARSGLSPSSHDGRTLLHILDTLPRDELFQASEDELFGIVIGILNLQERRRIALFVRRDPFERFVSCLVFAPRERYDTTLRQRFAAILEEVFAGRVSTFYTHLDESVLARVQFIIRTTRGAVPAVEVAAVERRLAEAGRSWSDRLEEAVLAEFGEEDGTARLRRLGPFPPAYQARADAAQAVADLHRIDAVFAGSPLEVSLHPGAADGTPGLRLYRAGMPVALSDVLPILENLGLRVVAEEPYRIDDAEAGAAWIHEFTLAGAAIETGVSAPVRAHFEEALVAAWTGQVESDGFNRLTLAAGLSARQTVVLRLYAKLLRQIGFAFSQAYMEDTLARYPAIARRLAQLFEIRHDPSRSAGRAIAAVAEIQAVDHVLDQVEGLDEDRILRAFLTLILKTLRTNYFQLLPSSAPKPYLAIKLASGEIDLLPQPRPLYEIYVYSPRIEGVHLRAGRVARGGIRWSDRKEDFRTEILGLMKAQTVKNAVIVPLGAKGGFIVKRPPADRDRLAAEAVECYKILIRGLLDLTDNIIADGSGGRRIVPPTDVVRLDGDDPYLVVAADKGTATFSDYANAIAEEYGFWLGDAFASGGSAGYDHKAMGITARGAFELIKRHFRELGHDIDAGDFTVIGVGDMSGDVFGNGMLLSRHIRLLGAFNHRHIFVDPDPDAEASFAERQRLFRLPRSSWTDYDPALISAGGGVFARSVKSIPISPEMKRIFAVEADRLTPPELIRAMLAAPVDLLWFGGIGTFVKDEEESHAEVGDRANDALRIDGQQIRAKIVGEGANLGVTERGRIGYALAGGRIDTDAIDNSAGVDLSDHEVNIKITLDHAIATGALPPQEREPLLAEMAPEVATLVLRDNYLQGEALSVAEARGAGALERQVRLMRALERAGRLDRDLEFLPDDEVLAERAAQRRGLTRPELAVLLAYVKMALYDELLGSDLPDAPAPVGELAGYFPTPLQACCGSAIETHLLHREIVATRLTNDLVNRAGLTFLNDLRTRTGRSAPDIARAFAIVCAAFDLRRRWAEIEALDNRVAAQVQTDLLLDIAALVEHAAAWLLKAGQLDVAGDSGRLAAGVESLAGRLTALLPSREAEAVVARAARLGEAGVPAPLAGWIGGTIFLASALEIVDLADRADQPLERAAKTYYGVGGRLALDALRAAAARLPADTAWQKIAAEAMIEDFFALQADLAKRILTGAAAETGDPLAAWVAEEAAVLAPVEALIAELRAAASPDLAMLTVALRQLRQALD